MFFYQNHKFQSKPLNYIFSQKVQIFIFDQNRKNECSHQNEFLRKDKVFAEKEFPTKINFSFILPQKSKFSHNCTIMFSDQNRKILP